MPLTIEEAQKMEGTEFTYVFDTEDSVQAFVKKIDLDKNPRLTCVSLDTQSKAGWKPYKGHSSLEEDGTFCVLSSITKEHILDILHTIKISGKYSVQDINKLSPYHSGAPICRFK